MPTNSGFSCDFLSSFFLRQGLSGSPEYCVVLYIQLLFWKLHTGMVIGLDIRHYSLPL